MTRHSFNFGSTAINGNGVLTPNSIDDKKAKANIAILPSRPSHSSVETTSELNGVGLLEFLETDERPILIFDLNSLAKTVPVYYNAPLQELHIARLKRGVEGIESIVEAAKDIRHSEFTQWAVNVSADEVMPVSIYCGIKWRRQTLRNRWRIIAGEGISQEVDDLKTQLPERPKLDQSQTILPDNSRSVSHNGMSNQTSPEEQPEPFTTAAAVLLEDEARRAYIAAEQATLDRNLLSRKLAIQTHETSAIESRFRRMADMAPVGLFHIDPSGSIVYANEYWFGLTQHEREVLSPMSWYNAIIESDQAVMDAQWLKLMLGEPVTFELRLRKPFETDEIINGEKVTGTTWIIVAAYPEKGEDGTVVGVLGCLTDISRQKWAEGFQERKMLEAVELKRQQENFIDITSHEIRNPLSAIIQCADMISTSLVEFDAGLQELVIPREIIDSHEDAAQTIIMCAQHQKRIIDDILTLSKLDSDLLLITPIEVQPISVIQNALKIFDGELQKNDIELRFVVERSYTDLNVDWVKLDPSRMLQVFINLVTNAIKFTQPEQKRKIAIHIGASLDHPAVRNGVEYLARSASHRDMTVGPDWGDGQPVYVYIEVQDSGRGMTEAERNLLFQRFAQASPRTHVQYGGSGLGLFISRELTELQGGQIGVASEAGVGSTFAFYVRVRRCSPPEDPNSRAADALDISAQAKLITTAALARVEDGLSLAGASQKSVLSPLVAAKHILIVEDNIVNQKVLSKQLRNAGCIVSVANHGGEALAFLEKSRFWKGKEATGKELSLVLMDLEMPIMDGLTCVKRIRQLQEEGMIVGHVPVIAVTANARSEQIATAKDSGMDSVVTKPFRIPQLMPEMDRQLRRGIERPSEVARSVSARP